MTMRQYLLLCIYVWKAEGKHIDKIGWTRTSSLWSDGCLVDGCFFPGRREVCLSYGIRDSRSEVFGPRGQISLKTIPSNTSSKTKNQKSEIKELKKYIINNYSKKCKDFSCLCTTCIAWRAWETLEELSGIDNKN